MSKSRCWVLVVVAGSLMAACGNDDDASGAGATTVPPTAAPESTAATATTTTEPASPVVVTSVEATTTVVTTMVATTAPPVPVTTVPSSDSGIVLAADGLGIVTFGTGVDETVAAVTAAIGEPSSVGEILYQPPIGDMQRYVWGALTLDFSGEGGLLFTSYEFAQGVDPVTDAAGNYTLELAEWAPSGWEAAVATADGLTVGDPASEAAALHPTVYVLECEGSSTEHSPTDETGDGIPFFVVPGESGLWLRSPIEGALWSIGAQAMANPLRCDGA